MSINWDNINTIANIAMTVIALVSLALNFYLLRREKKLRNEDIRARLSISIVDWQGKYMLKVTNVGKETAYKIKLDVSGKSIEENLYSFVREAFAKLSKISFCLEVGQSAYYLISPDERCKGEEGLEGYETISSRDIIDWLKNYDNESIFVKGQYCDKYKIKEELSIREYLLYGSFEVKDPIQELADAFSSRDPKDKNIQKNIELLRQEVAKIRG